MGFHGRDGGTELVLTQTRLADATTRDEHICGRDGCVDRLVITFPA